MASPFLSHWAKLENVRGDIRLPFQREKKKGRLSIWTIQAGNCKYALELYWNRAFSESFGSGKDHANGYESTFDLRLIFLSLAWYFQGFIETVYRLFSLSFNPLWIYKKSNEFMKYSYNRLILEGFTCKGGFMNPRGGYFRNFGVGMCRWDSGTLNLNES